MREPSYTVSVENVYRRVYQGRVYTLQYTDKDGAQHVETFTNKSTMFKFLNAHRVG